MTWNPGDLKKLSCLPDTETLWQDVLLVRVLKVGNFFFSFSRTLVTTDRLELTTSHVINGGRNDVGHIHSTTAVRSAHCPFASLCRPRQTSSNALSGALTTPTYSIKETGYFQAFRSKRVESNKWLEGRPLSLIAAFVRPLGLPRRIEELRLSAHTHRPQAIVSAAAAGEVFFVLFCLLSTGEQRTLSLSSLHSGQTFCLFCFVLLAPSAQKLTSDGLHSTLANFSLFAPQRPLPPPLPPPHHSDNRDDNGDHGDNNNDNGDHSDNKNDNCDRDTYTGVKGLFVSDNVPQ